jgi:hypothetical protein
MPVYQAAGAGPLPMAERSRRRGDDLSVRLGYLLSGIDWRHPQETWHPTSVGQQVLLADRGGCDSSVS